MCPHPALQFHHHRLPKERERERERERGLLAPACSEEDGMRERRRTAVKERCRKIA
jgi:hypothetical protein